MTAAFVHLRVHTEYSLTDGIVRLEPPKRKGGGSGATLTSRAAELKLPALAITDRDNLFAMVKFYKAAEKEGIKPIVGADVQLEPRAKNDAPERITLLVGSELGYRNLTRLLSLAYTEGQAKGYPLVGRAVLRAHAAGLVALTGRDGAVQRAAAADNVEAALGALSELKEIFPSRLYLEISRCGRPGDEEWVKAAVALARRESLPLAATNDVRFLLKTEFNAHEARVCIAQGRVLNDDKRPRDYTPEQYLKSADEMAALFHDLPEALANTVEIARRCTIKLKLGENHLPQFPAPEGHDAESWLRQCSSEGLTKRLKEIPPSQPEHVYRERLEYELGIIKQMGFAGYFLVVADFIAWAKTHGCPVGPGRGSGAGSLVAYALGITDLDPLPYQLLFERFLNPERVSLPDFDVDFCMDNRDRVIAYVSEKYGRDHVGQIITYATMAARGVVRDVARVMGHGYGFGDSIAKLIPGMPGATLADALDTVPELKQRYRDEEDTRAVLDLALELEGVTRGVGVHAGGVVIAPRPLTDYAPLYCEPGGAGLRTQFDMKDLESVGLVKFDFLGLKTLTILQAAVDMLEEKTGNKIDLLKLPLDDAQTYKLYATGDTSAVFQMESPGMQKASRDLKPDTFEDIIALVSLYRPGPMELIPDYCARKRGDAKVEYLHPDMEKVLAPTYGIFVYQEQVMQMSQRLAGYSLGGADLLRRAMGKKIAAEMAKQREVFQKGATGRGVDASVATQVFDLMEKFANYGFNKSHAAAYALVSYQTAWLKAHHPAEFMASVLSCEMNHTETVVTMLDECRRMGLKVHAPDVNASDFKFTVPAPREIHYGLGAIKGMGEAALEGVLAERAKNGPFTDLFDFCRRVDLHKVNKRVLEAMIYSGAFDGFRLNRASLLKTLPKALAAAEQAAASASAGQNDLFGIGGGTAKTEQNLEAEHELDWPLREKLAHERETLGHYFSAHPIESYGEIIDQVCSGRLRDLIAAAPPPPAPGPDGKVPFVPRQKVMFAAWVADVRFFKGQESSGRAARASYKVTLDDKTAILSTWVDVDKWTRWANIVRPDSLVFAIAEVAMSIPREGKPSEPRLYNPEFIAADAVMHDYAARITLDWKRGAGDVAALQKALAPFRAPKSTPVTLNYFNGKASAVLELPAEWQVRLSDASVAALSRLVGADCVKVAYRKFVPPQTERRFERAFAGGDDE